MGQAFTMTGSFVSGDILSFTVAVFVCRMLSAGPLLARCGKASIASPGGCAIGENNKRPVNLHMDVLTAMRVKVEESGGSFDMSVQEGLHGADVLLSYPSVGTTCTFLLAAASAQGCSSLQNAACEPEVRWLGSNHLFPKQLHPQETNCTSSNAVLH